MWLVGLLDHVKLHLVDNLEKANELKRWLSPLKKVAVDTETTGFSPERDRVRMLQFGDADQGWALPIENGWHGLGVELLNAFDGELIMWNKKFDYSHIKSTLGVKLKRHLIHDGAIQHRILHPHKSPALKTVSGRIVDATAAYAQGGLDQAMSKNGWTWATVPMDFDLYWIYGALDCVLTYRAEDILRAQVLAQAPKAYELESAVAWVLNDMERYGAHIDVPYAREHMQKFEDFCEQVKDWCIREYGFSPGSNDKVIAVLKEAGFTFDKKTDSGRDALDRDVLEGIAHPLAESVLLRRQLSKLSSTYLSHFVNDCSTGGLIHPSINPMGARTSRMSMSAPNLQNLPRRNENNKGARVVRNSVTSRYDNGRLVLCDFDQIEMRLLAHLTGDQGLIHAFDEGDFFINLARKIYQDDSIVKGDPRRQLTKNGGYATVYGSGIAKFAETAGVSYEQAAEFSSLWQAMYPGVPQFMMQTVHTGKRRLREEGEAYAYLPLTGRRMVADAGKEYTLTNYLIQGTAAEAYKMKLVELDAAGVGEFMMLPVHDEVILDVPHEHVDDVAQTLRRVMNDATMFDVPITASVSTAERWGEKKDYVFS